MTVRKALHKPVPKAALPAFAPVPRKQPRHDGWTPERQIAFIEALADTGCVAIACRMVNMSQPSFYQLRRQPGAESFRAAAEAAQTLGLQCAKDEAFERAMHGELIPVFVAGKLMGFRRKKNDRLLMFILRHYGQDAAGRRTTINYFSTRATAAAGAAAPSGSGPTRSGAPASARDAPSGRPTTGEAVSIDVTNSVRDGGPALAAGSSAVALAKAEASTTTVKTVISGSPNAPSQLAADTSAANTLNAFEGVALDAEAQAEIYRSLEACAERRRALEETPEHDPERFYIGEEETNGYLGQLESGVEGDWVEYRPEGEHRWEGLGEGGEAAEIDKVVGEMQARLAAETPEARAEREAAENAMARAQREKSNKPLPDYLGNQAPGLPPPEPEADDPMLDWRNWKGGAYLPPDSELSAPAFAGEGDHEYGGGGTPSSARPELVEGPFAPPPKAGAKRTYKPRTPKPAFTPPDEKRKARAIAAVAEDRREAASAEAERRKRRNKPTKLS